MDALTRATEMHGVRIDATTRSRYRYIMERWTELRTALMLARLGTVKGAAEALGIHRATVNRHIDALERDLGAPLFQRHSKGYSLTETGHDMLVVTSRADELFTEFAGRSTSRSGQLSGSLVVTALAGVAPLVLPALKEFSRLYPEIEVEFLAGAQLARLEHGEAHIAVRAGNKPATPDYVVQPFRSIYFALYAHEDYLSEYGQVDAGNLAAHKFIGSVGEPSPLPYARWMDEFVDPATLVVRTSSQTVINHAVCSGLGLGFLADYDADSFTGLVKVLPADEALVAPLWLVTHGDLHRTLKVQEFLRLIKKTSS